VAFAHFLCRLVRLTNNLRWQVGPAFTHHHGIFPVARALSYRV
jgi:hypothetical protein